MNGFPQELFSVLKNYVYRLIDPATGATFYVGRGVENRCFRHVNVAQRALKRLEVDGEPIDEIEGKFAQIKKILDRHEEVVVVIHRHGLTPEIAKEVEAALIDAYPGTQNEIRGNRSVLASRSAADLIREHGLTEIPLGKDFLMCVNVASSLGVGGRDVGEAASYAWKIDETKWNGRMPLVLAYSSAAYGEVLGVFVVKGVLPAEEFRARNEAKFPIPTEGTRKALLLEDAGEELKTRYLGKRIPPEYRQPAPTYPDREAVLFGKSSDS